MGGSSVWLFLFLIVPACLPLFIKRPLGINRYGGATSPKTIGQAVEICFKKYADFNGRAARSEYWWFYLVAVVIGFALGFLATLLKVPLLGYGSYAFTLPLLAAGVRRLHDINRSGWWLLIGFGLGAIVLLFMLTQPSQRDDAEIAQVFS